MLNILIRHQIGQHLTGFKFRFSLIMVVLMFAVTTISYISDHSSNIESHTKLVSELNDSMTKRAEESATKLAGKHPTNHVL